MAKEAGSRLDSSMALYFLTLSFSGRLPAFYINSRRAHPVPLLSDFFSGLFLF